MSKHVLVTDAEGETKHIGVRQNRAEHRQQPETRGHTASSKAPPEEGSDEAVRDNRRHRKTNSIGAGVYGLFSYPSRKVAARPGWHDQTLGSNSLPPAGQEPDCFSGARRPRESWGCRLKRSGVAPTLSQ